MKSLDKQESFGPLGIALIIIMSVSIVASYIGLNLIYNIEDVDDAWSLSFMYNAFVRHIPPESTFGGGMANLNFFGMTQAYVYAGILNCVGWTKGNSHLVSAFFMLLASCTWYGILRKLNFSRKVSLYFCLLVLWCEPFFRVALLPRPEALTFFLVSLAFYFLVCERFYFPAGLLAAVAVENHPMGIVFFVYALAYAASRRAEYWKDRRLLARKALLLAAGVACGAVYYVAIHFHYLHQSAHIVRQGATELAGSVLYQYFFVCVNYFRHVADFVFFCFCLVLYFWKGLYKENRFVLFFLLFLVAANFVNPRGNYEYSLYFYPGFLLLSLFVFEKFKRLEWAAAILFLFFFAYNLTIVYRKHSYDFNAYVATLQSAVPGNSIQVVGSTNEWYAFRDREYYPAIITYNFDTAAPSFYLIEGNDYRLGHAGDKRKVPFREQIEHRYSGAPVASVAVNGERFDIELMKKNR
jgi:hypothetical protein